MNLPAEEKSPREFKKRRNPAEFDPNCLEQLSQRIGAFYARAFHSAAANFAPAAATGKIVMIQTDSKATTGFTKVRK